MRYATAPEFTLADAARPVPPDFRHTPRQVGAGRMTEWLAVIGGAFATGFTSALFPLVNSEIAAGAAAWQLDWPLAWTAVVVLALSQTAGKVVVYESSRAGRALGSRIRRRSKLRLAEERPAETDLPEPQEVTVTVGGSSDVTLPAGSQTATAVQDQPASAPVEAAPSDRTSKTDKVVQVVPTESGKRPGRLRVWGQRLFAYMNTRARSNAVLALSAVVGFPPLLFTAVMAGALRMRRLDFILIVACGRIIRLAIVAWPVMALTH
ncbi:MAG: hypothetical protein LBH68_07490 [Bifidobacteriaceae bacterium]|jgi:membrane protein YqaA with SNARE-associated domain|nr:hypothetical protein [Bifidobacteriaceae bacterium]